MSISQIKVVCGQNQYPEKQYIIQTLFQEYLGLAITIEFALNDSYSIHLNNQTLIIEDHFFSQFHEPQSYLAEKNIPANIERFTHPDYNASGLPVIYGNPIIEEVSEGTIKCHIDIFASSFFMLTRWEEYVNSKRDQHGRYPATESLAYKHAFLDRPVVNEYLELLKALLLKLDASLQFKCWQFQCIPTHDIDHIRKWGTLSDTRKKLAHDFITKFRPLTGLENMIDAALVWSGLRKDPYDTFNYIVDLSKKHGLTSRFYFLCGGTDKLDNNFDIRDAASVIEYLLENEQIIGFHPSYSSHLNIDQWGKEKLMLETIAGRQMVEGRQHYLRFEAPFTWRLWNEMEMNEDSTAGYSEFPGFRCGTCYPFKVFDFIERKTLRLVENPMVLMETTLITYMKLKPKEAYHAAKKLYLTVKKFNGNFTFLWHNSAMHTVEDKPYLYVYESIVKGFADD